MRPPRRRPLYRVGDLLPGLASQLGFDEELRAARAMSSWRRVVEEHAPAASGASQLIEIRAPALVVSAEDAASGQELRLCSAQLLDAFAGAPGGTRLLELKVVVRSPGRGPTTPGRGPAGQPR